MTHKNPLLNNNKNYNSKKLSKIYLQGVCLNSLE